jgi:hypothetical protein
LLVRTEAGDEHVFRSIPDRDTLLDIIRNHHTNRDDGEMRDAEIESPADEALDANQTITRQLFEYASGDTDVMNSSIRSESGTEIDTTDSRMERVDVDSDDEDDVKSLAWGKVKQQSKDWESAVANLKLPFPTVSSFFDTCLSNEARNPLSIFHGNVMGDKNISISGWERDEKAAAAHSDESSSRTIRFEHKSRVNTAQVTRNQTYRCYGKNACLKNVTNIKGVPSGTLSWFFPFLTMQLLYRVITHFSITLPSGCLFC